MLGALAAALVRELPVDAIPDLSDPQVVLRARWPGQAPRLVEEQLAYPLSSRLLAVPGARAVRSFAMFGDAFLYVLFEEGTAPAAARGRVLEALARAEAELPPGASLELGPPASALGWVFQYALVDRSGRHDLAALTDLQEWFLARELRALPGVAEVARVGGMLRRYEAVVDPIRLRGLGLEWRELASAVAAAGRERGGGVIELAEAEHPVTMRGLIRSLDDLAAVPTGRLDRGTPVLLGQVAAVREAPAPRQGIAELDGEGEVVGGIVVTQEGADPARVARAVRARLAALAPSLPEGVEVVTVYDRTELVGRALAFLGRKLLEELAMVVLVCLLFLGSLRSALPTLLLLPLGVLLAFASLRLAGLAADLMALAGIALALGAMVDSALVMTENAGRRLAILPAGLDPGRRRLALAAAALEVAPALFVSLLIVALSFLPVLLLSGQEGRLFAPLAWSKTFAMLAAALLALSLGPALIAASLRRPAPVEERHWLTAPLIRGYRPLLRRALARPRATLAIAVALALSALWPLYATRQRVPARARGGRAALHAEHGGRARSRQGGGAAPAELAADPRAAGGRAGFRQDRPRRERHRPGAADHDRDRGAAEAALGMAPGDGPRGPDRRARPPGAAARPGQRLGAADPRPDRDAGDRRAHRARGAAERARTSTSSRRWPSGSRRCWPSCRAPAPPSPSAAPPRAISSSFLTASRSPATASRWPTSPNGWPSAIGGEPLAQAYVGRARYAVALRLPPEWRDSPERLAGLVLRTPSGTEPPLGRLARIAIVAGAGDGTQRERPARGLRLRRARARGSPRLRGAAAAGAGRTDRLPARRLLGAHRPVRALAARGGAAGLGGAAGAAHHPAAFAAGLRPRRGGADRARGAAARGRRLALDDVAARGAALGGLAGGPARPRRGGGRVRGGHAALPRARGACPGRGRRAARGRGAARGPRGGGGAQAEAQGDDRAHPARRAHADAARGGHRGGDARAPGGAAARRDAERPPARPARRSRRLPAAARAAAAAGRSAGVGIGDAEAREQPPLARLHPRRLRPALWWSWPRRCSVPWIRRCARWWA
ncbi:MAG: efflux RND transporter permease subunit [Xanthomonadales bacterium]|nr:efflux RND transporter permease subunit [Xanthomonadales bacterium]